MLNGDQISVSHWRCFLYRLVGRKSAYDAGFVVCFQNPLYELIRVGKRGINNFIIWGHLMCVWGS